MKRMERVLWLVFVFMFTAIPVASPRSQPPPPRPKQAQQGAQQAVLVGRIAFVEGELLRFVPEDEDWVVTVKDAPFGLEDSLYADDNVKAEFILPNMTWVRIGGSTQLQLIRLEDDITDMDVASGIARFYNKSNSAVMKITTPFGYVMAPAKTIFDLYVGDESVEIVAIKGTVDFIHTVGDTRYEVAAGSSSLLADSQQVTSGEGTVDEDWDAWNNERDDTWAKRVQVKGDSVKYLPDRLHDESYELEENGRWESVEYEGSRRQMWRPVNVQADWAPYTYGRWTEYYGDQTWVPDEPFGYTTHHYGNWVNVNSGWYWAPPVVSVNVGLPLLNVGWGWYPGRVGWIHSGVSVGWVPLAPFETYYSHRYWGPRGVIAPAVGIGVAIGGFAYLNHAVIVNQSNFWGHRNYRDYRIANINRTTIINNYRGAGVVNNTVINNYRGNRARYQFSDARVTRRPHQDVVQRINRNQALAKQDRNLRGRDLQRNVDRMKPGKLERGGQVKAPRISNKLVNPEDARKSRNELKFQEKSLKAKGGAQPRQLEATGAGKAGRDGRDGREGREVKSPRGERGQRVKGGGAEETGAVGRNRRGEAAERGQHRIKPGTEGPAEPMSGAEGKRGKQRQERQERQLRGGGQETGGQGGAAEGRRDKQRQDKQERQLRGGGQETGGQGGAAEGRRDKQRQERLDRQQRGGGQGAGAAGVEGQRQRQPRQERQQQRQEQQLQQKQERQQQKQERQQRQPRQERQPQQRQERQQQRQEQQLQQKQERQQQKQQQKQQNQQDQQNQRKGKKNQEQQIQ